MTAVTTTGRAYRYAPKQDPAVFLAWARERYAEVEGRPATYCAVHPDGFERFSLIWPGSVVEDRRVLRGEIMLGVDG